MKKTAQSLIETLIAVAIAASAIVAILALGQTFLNLGGQSTERVLATNLGREGIEVVQAIRASYWLDSSVDWLDEFAEGSYRVQWNSQNLDDLNPPNNPTIENCTNCWLYLEGNPAIYSYNCSSCQAPIFKRIIKVENFTPSGGCVDEAPCGKKITSTVWWQERGRPHKIFFKLVLTDWRE
ncbi:MAG: hypothetical protein BWY03_00268 [Parcubacteria group bacterium ADurb.Bin159]|jgi:hypothetical protein|nr:MAG: hypothetical protein BWY03_00268 [Parcubacteria group bacterium ADurb.Bin159]